MADGASASVFGRRGASPLQVYVLRPVTESNCVVVRRGGKQLEVNDQSVTVVNSIRPGCLASLPSYGEAQTDERRKPMTLRGSVSKRSWEQSGVWRRNGWKARHMKQRDLSDDCDGVHVPDSGLCSFANVAGTDRYEEPVAQESEDPYER